jgi:hypothetical protein
MALGLACTLALSATFVLPATAQETGRVTGQITSAQTMRPLDGAQVSIEGTGMGGLANAQGRYLLLNVAPGTYTIRTTIIGYATARQQVTVVAGEVATVDFQLAETALSLDELVVTGTAAEVRAKEVGNSLDAVTSREIENIPVLRNSEDILAGRAPGVTVMGNSGQPGAGGTIKIRGISSISNTKDPLIYVDGIRIFNEPTRSGWGARTSTSWRDPDLHEEGDQWSTHLERRGVGWIQPSGFVRGQHRWSPDGPVHQVREPGRPVFAEDPDVFQRPGHRHAPVHPGPDLPLRR